MVSKNITETFVESSINNDTLVKDFLKDGDITRIHLANNSLYLLNENQNLPPIASVITLELCKKVIALSDLDKVIICDSSKEVKDFNIIVIDPDISEYEVMSIYTTEGLDSIIEKMQKVMIDYITSVTDANDNKLQLYGVIPEFGYSNPVQPLIPSVMIRIYMKLGDDSNG